MDNAPVDMNRFPKLARWLRDDANTTWLSSLLNSPQGELLFDVLEELAKPSQTIENLGSRVSDPGNLDVLLARMQCITSGQFLTIENLRSLQYPVELPTEMDNQGWQGQALQRKVDQSD